MKELIKQFIPPIGMRCIRALRGEPQRPPEDPRIAELREGFDSLNRQSGLDEICLRDGLTLKIHPESRNAFEFFCVHSPTMVQELDCFIEKSRDRHRLLDVGALHGIFSLVFAAGRGDRKSVAVDASPIAFARLLYNIHKNDAKNVEPIECAMSDDVGSLAMHYEWEHAVAAGTNADASNTILLEKTTGDRLCASLDYRPDVIKIDVEGHELKVLKGLQSVLDECRPLVFLELHPGRIHEEGDHLRELVEIFSRLNYRAEFVNGSAISIEKITELVDDERLVLQPA